MQESDSAKTAADSSVSTKALVLRYFNAWQARDFEAMRRCLADDIHFDGCITFRNADDLVAFCENQPAWKDVCLRYSVFTEHKAALVYEAINEVGAKVRVGEFLTIDNGKIQKGVGLGSEEDVSESKMRI